MPFGDNMLTPYQGSSSLKKKNRTCDPIPFWKHFRAEKLKDQSTDSSSEFADHWVVLNDPKVYKIIKLLSLFSFSYFPLGIFFLLLLTAVWGECEKKKCSCWGRDWKSLSWNSFSPSSLVAGSHILESSPRIDRWGGGSEKNEALKEGWLSLVVYFLPCTSFLFFTPEMCILVRASSAILNREANLKTETTH